MSDELSREAIEVVIVEGDDLTRKALSLAVNSDPTLRLVADFDRVKPTLAWLESNAPDVLLTDLGLTDGSGLDIIRACSRRYPRVAVMVVTVSSDEAHVLACIEAGASGYVLKDAGKPDIADAVRDLGEGGAPMSPVIARMVMARIRDGKKSVATNEEHSSSGLTPREATILELIAQGDSYGEVAKLLSVSVGTVQTHIKNIYGKLAVHSRGEAVFEAYRRGLLQIGRRSSRA